MNETINIAMVEDNKSFLTTLENMIKVSESLEYSASFNNAEDCIQKLKDGQMPAVDVLLLDLGLPDKNGLTLIPIWKKHMPATRIIVLTMNDNYLTTLEAIKLGVAGYILKGTSITDIRSTIHDVHKGGTVIDPQLSRLVLDALTLEKAPKNNALSPREREVLELLAMGYVKKEVADKLDLSYSAIALYTENVYKKLQVPNVAAAVATAIRKGLI